MCSIIGLFFYFKILIDINNFQMLNDTIKIYGIHWIIFYFGIFFCIAFDILILLALIQFVYYRDVTHSWILWKQQENNERWIK